jgi:hypothetical protein
MQMRICAWVLACALIGGCAPTAPLIIEQPIGPYEPKAVPPDYGVLVVYSELEPRDGDPDYLVHSAYTIKTLEGTLVRQVDNHNGVLDRDPTPVSLPEGRYRVLARSDYGDLSLVAVIQPGRRTVIDLNEEVLPTRDSQNQSWVRLPSGQIVGARSD